jgi:hypothetical protein
VDYFPILGGVAEGKARCETPARCRLGRRLARPALGSVGRRLSDSLSSAWASTGHDRGEEACLP